MSGGTQNLSKFEVDGHVAQITLNRPEAMNSLNPELRWELSHHFDEVERNDDIWVAVVTGAGERAFCAGADLKHRAREREADGIRHGRLVQLAEVPERRREGALELGGPVAGDFDQRLSQLGVREAEEERRSVRVEVEAGRRLQGRRDRVQDAVD